MIALTNSITAYKLAAIELELELLSILQKNLELCIELSDIHKTTLLLMH